MKDLLLVAFDVINNINSDIDDQVGEQDFYCNLEIKTNADEIDIYFGSYCLWNSEDDEREWISSDVVDNFNPEEDEYPEPLEPFIRKELNSFLDVLRKIKV